MLNCKHWKTGCKCVLCPTKSFANKELASIRIHVVPVAGSANIEFGTENSAAILSPDEIRSKFMKLGRFTGGQIKSTKFGHFSDIFPCWYSNMWWLTNLNFGTNVFCCLLVPTQKWKWFDPEMRGLPWSTMTGVWVFVSINQCRYPLFVVKDTMLDKAISKQPQSNLAMVPLCQKQVFLAP